MKREIEMPDVIGLPINEAKKTIKDLNLEIEIIGEENEEKVVINQLPKKGIKIQEGTKITLYVN